jgi:hypothetical protein
MTRREKAELLALMWSGRDCQPNFRYDMETAYEQVDEHTAIYIAGKSGLAKYLREGLKQFRYPLRIAP